MVGPDGLDGLLAVGGLGDNDSIGRPFEDAAKQRSYERAVVGDDDAGPGREAAGA